MTNLSFGLGFMGGHGALLEAADLKIRVAGVAGSFYPADPNELTSMMDGFLARVAMPRIEGQILAVVAPHAGYPYSGLVAAYAYAALKGRAFRRVVVIAPSHYDGFDFTSVYDGDGYSTPLGTLKIDKQCAERLAAMEPSLRLSERGHTTQGRDAEHALEVQLPWLQRVLGEFTLVPVIMGDQSYANSRDLGVSLAKLLADEEMGSTLIVASSDLSHFHSSEHAENLDRRTLQAVESGDYFSMSRNFQQGVWEACGGGPIIAAMIAAERRGANQAVILEYANSGDITGDRFRVVGYGAVALVKCAEQQSMDQECQFSEIEKEKLIALARRSVDHAIRERKVYDPPAPSEMALKRESGAFVTLRKGRELRGCIGYTAPTHPLYQTIRDTATLAAVEDPRFRPVSADEVDALEYEISVLSPLRWVQNVEEIRVGVHGLLIKNGDREGLLLPQVAIERHWDRLTFLEQTCVKAGIPKDGWKREGTDVFCFRAEVFGDRQRTEGT